MNLELALLIEEAEAKIMTTPITDSIDPIHRVWLKKNRMIHDQDM
jgi:hypothetical protein